jgi:hypothetical protein
VQLDEQTKLVMGKKADIHPGAVVHVTGTIRDDHSILAEQLVILTGICPDPAAYERFLLHQR